MVSRRKVQTDCGHEVDLKGAWSLTTDQPPVILERQEEDFIGTLLEDLHGDTFGALATNFRPKQTGPDGLLRLFQPVHRVFNLALLEAHCTSFGLPRLDARQIDSAGLVVRRVRTLGTGRVVYDAWCATKGVATGWVALPPESDPAHAQDPEPARRPQVRYTGNVEFDRARFGPSGPPASEDTVSLFIAPPPVATHTKRTVLYGVIPLASSSRAGAMAKGPEPADDKWSDHISVLLKTRTGNGANSVQWPDSLGRNLDKEKDLGTSPITLGNAVSTNATRFVLLVRQLTQEFQLLAPVNPQTVASLVTTLNELTVTLIDGSTRKLGDYLLAAADVYFTLRLETETTPSLPRPDTWPAISGTQADTIRDRLKQISAEIELQMFATASGAGRYDDPGARYVIRAFVRVKQPCDCPPKIVWSPYSERFSIAPWFESGPGGPVPVMLPDLTPDFLKKAKPNVAFSVPSSLANVLNQDPKSFFTGLAGKGSGFSLDFICGFNIPIITICAFILLNIMLNLLNIIFRWLPYVKVCIPFPRPPATTPPAP